MIRGLFRAIRRWFRGLFFGMSARTAATRRSFSGPGILDVGTDGTIRITPITSPAPIGPRVVANATFTNARTQRLARRAAAFLFDHYGFAAVPAQFWPIFERSFDPAKAMDAFLRAVGCDPTRVRRRDPHELIKAGEVIELLILSGDILHKLSPKVRHIVGLQLESGDYAKIRNLAEVASHLQAAVDFASPWSGKAVVASFSDLLLTIQRMLDNPLSISAADAASAVGLVAKFADAQRRFDAMTERFSALAAALGDTWPDRWRGTSQEAALRKHVGDFERVAESMRSSFDLSFDDLHEGNAFLAGCIAQLEDLFEAARGRDAGDRSRGGHFGGKTSPPPPDEKEEALRFFGFSTSLQPKTAQELKSAWRSKLKLLHPDTHPGATEDERRRMNEDAAKCNRYYKELQIRFSWSRSV